MGSDLGLCRRSYGFTTNGDNYMLKQWNAFKVRTAVVLSLITLLGVAISVRADDAKLLKKSELKSLIANARTAQDHARLADHFTAKAEQLEADAKDHEEYAARYKGISGKLRMTSYHCENVAAGLRKAAEAARQLAADHREMAQEAKRMAFPDVGRVRKAGRYTNQPEKS